jgi:hypothetical protein
MCTEMRRSIPRHLKPVALLVGILLSTAVVLSDSQLVFGISLVLLAVELLAMQAPAVLADLEDDSE